MKQGSLLQLLVLLASRSQGRRDIETRLDHFSNYPYCLLHGLRVGEILKQGSLLQLPVLLASRSQGRRDIETRLTSPTTRTACFAVSGSLAAPREVKRRKCHFPPGIVMVVSQYRFTSLGKIVVNTSASQRWAGVRSRDGDTADGGG